jgi:hypothetical protein
MLQGIVARCPFVTLKIGVIVPPYFQLSPIVAWPGTSVLFWNVLASVLGFVIASYMRFVPQYTVPVHLVIAAKAAVIDDAMLVLANVMLDDMLKFPETRPDIP